MLVGYEKVIASEQVCISDAHLWNKTVKFFPLQGCDGQIRYDFWLCRYFTGQVCLKHGLNF